ncbi:MAG TPA: N-acetylneuraminate synthase family protein [bacterium]
MVKIPFVAEVSSNHNRDLSRCLEFVDNAAAIGCAAVKFQLFKINELFAPEILRKSANHRRRQEWELPVEFLPELSARCRQLGMAFGCTPFYLKAVDELYDYVDFYKISSYELLWSDLLTACARTGKPVVISTGMADFGEVQCAVSTLQNASCKNFTLLHCVSNYPTKPQDCHLGVMGRYRESFGCAVGWSDHSVNPGVIQRAINHWGAAMVEFHLDLDGRGAEFTGGHCWLPHQIQPLIEQVGAGLLADGSAEKIFSENELKERDWRADPSDGLRPFKHLR